MKPADDKQSQNIILANKLIEIHDKGLDVDNKIDTEAKKMADIAQQKKKEQSQTK